VEVYNLYRREWVHVRQAAFITDLVATLISNEHYERPVVRFDIVVDENGYSRVELFAHDGPRKSEESLTRVLFPDRLSGGGKRARKFSTHSQQESKATKRLQVHA
jgi:hypothetical protein